MIKTSFEIMVETKENNLSLVKKWVDRDELVKKLLDLKNKNIQDTLPISTKKRLLGWNESIEVLLEELGVDEE